MTISSAISNKANHSIDNNITTFQFLKDHFFVSIRTIRREIHPYNGNLIMTKALIPFPTDDP